MKPFLNILHLEDDPHDAELVHSALNAGGIPCAITNVHHESAFVAALEGGGVDLILSDYTLPGFDGMSAMRIANLGWPAIPLIFVSGTLGEERAVESLRSGATDYVLKGNLARLAPAVLRAMDEVEARAERGRLEAQVIEAQKMEVLGQLAAGVAHDFNNILAVIMGCSELITAGLARNSPLLLYSKEILHASERAAGLTRQLLVFSRKQTVQAAVLDLNEVVKYTDEMLRRLIDENITMKVVPEKAIGRVKADAGYIGQVLMNLVVNARDAMPTGGKLTVATHNVTVDERQAQSLTKDKPGNYVVLSVSDTGIGMSEEVKAHLFEAFFTTKPKDRGTGLGLATCRNIIEQSGGFIGFESELGKGTTFKVYFPRVELPADASLKLSPTGPIPRGTETLLVVEDDPSLRHMARGVLEGQGYKVLSASNGQEGLHVAREHKGPPISLVVSDVVMPQMSGKVMAEWFSATYPEIMILFTSGYMDEALAHHNVLASGVEFLAKPYTPGSLARKVRELLDRKTLP